MKRIATPWLTLAAAAALAACSDTGVDLAPEQPRRDPHEGFATRMPVETGWVWGPDGQPMEVSFEVHEGHAIWDGDIDLGPAETVARTRQALRPVGPEAPKYGVIRSSTSARWPGGVVPYVVDSNVPSQSRITNAIAHIEANTVGVDFVPRTNQTNYIRVRTSTGCSSSVGRVGGVQYVNLASGCSTGNTIHEFLHALGMYHEQSRCDRDTYVTIQLQNVQSGATGNFSKVCSAQGGQDVNSYNEGSIMHYDDYAFSANGQPTILSKRGLASQMGQRSGMSSIDISTVNYMYP